MQSGKLKRHKGDAEYNKIGNSDGFAVALGTEKVHTSALSTADLAMLQPNDS